MTNFNFGRCAITSTAVALIAGCGGSQPPIRTSVGAGASDTYANHHTFHYTGKKQVFSVPASVTNIKVIAIGGDGAPNYGRAGYGGRVSAVIPVTPYEDLWVFVGGNAYEAKGGFNGGGHGGTVFSSAGYGGGGASDVREDRDGLSNRILVAAAVAV